MSLIVVGFVAPVALALIVWIRMSVHLASRVSDEPGAPSAARSMSAGSAAGRWDGLTEEIAQRGNRRPRRPRRLNEAAARRRHLAAVLPADPRR